MMLASCESALRSSIHEKSINKKDATFIMLALCGMRLPLLMCPWEFIQEELSKVQVTLADILSKMKPSMLSKKEYDLYCLFRFAFKAFQHGMWATRCAHFKHILNGKYKRGLAGRRWLNRFGFYNESNAWLRPYPTKRVQLQTINNFFLEKYKSISPHFRYFSPFSRSDEDSNSKWLDNALFGIRIFSLIEMGKVGKARMALNKGMKHKAFINNSIITFCAYRLNLQRLQNVQFLQKPDDQRDIFRLFEGMIAQFHDVDYRKAVCLYHECNFYSAHPIQYYRLYECYLAMGLYRRASKYLERAQQSARGQIPSIKKDIESKRAVLDSLMGHLQCANCGRRIKNETSSKYRIWPCSGCLKVWYCSKRCQKIQWNEWHREHCSRSYMGIKGELKFSKQSPLCRDFTVFDCDWS